MSAFNPLLIRKIHKRRKAWADRFAALDAGQAALITGSLHAMARSRELLLRTESLPGMPARPLLLRRRDQ